MLLSLVWSRCGFNPRPREGGDPSGLQASANSGRFNPRPREGGDPSAFLPRRSISPVSIRAPVKGAIGCRARQQNQTRRFNPRPREGGDP